MFRNTSVRDGPQHHSLEHFRGERVLQHAQPSHASMGLKICNSKQIYKFHNPGSPSNVLSDSGTACSKQTHPRPQARIWTSTSLPTLKTFLLFLNQGGGSSLWMKPRFWLTIIKKGGQFFYDTCGQRKTLYIHTFSLIWRAVRVDYPIFVKNW